MFKTTDGGGSWSAVNTGLPATVVSRLAVDATTSPSTVYASTDHGVFKTTDGGASWSPANTGLPAIRRFTNSQTSTMVRSALAKNFSCSWTHIRTIRKLRAWDRMAIRAFPIREDCFNERTSLQIGPLSLSEKSPPSIGKKVRT